MLTLSGKGAGAPGSLGDVVKIISDQAELRTRLKVIAAVKAQYMVWPHPA